MAPSLNDSRHITGGAIGTAPIDPSTAESIAGVHPADGQELTPRETAVVDARQDVLMASTSADGGPPSHRQRTIGWRWVAIVLPVLLVSAATWAMVRGVSVGAVIGFGIGFLLLLLLGGSPVWAVGLIRGQEERTARKQAVDELLGEKRQ